MYKFYHTDVKNEACMILAKSGQNVINGTYVPVRNELLLIVDIWAECWSNQDHVLDDRYN